ncbi:TlpA disulfide reductase family protein [Staphylococcus chromogenes]|nr:TlpA disulfide reductase family protein [Staphylococcus chromogenes]
MNNTVKWSVTGSVLILAMLLALVPGMLGKQPHSDDQPQAQVAARPECPTATVAGVPLPCLGAKASDRPQNNERRGTVVNVWAWWCGPCREELPLFDELARTHPELEVVGVHADPNAANGAAMLNDLGIELPSYQDNSGAFAGQHALPGVVPITVLVRPDGSIAAKFPKTFTSAAELEEAIKGANL